MVRGFLYGIYAAAFLVGPFLLPDGMGAFSSQPYQPLSLSHPFGTDYLGRDMLARVLVAGQTSLLICTIAAAVAFSAGLCLAVFSSLAPQRVSSLVSRCMDALIAIPGLVAAFILIAAFGSSIASLIVIITIVEFCRVYRTLRAPVAQVVSQPFLEMSRLRGESFLYLVRFDVWPSIRPYATSELIYRFIASLLFLSSISVLGLGVQPPNTDWGTLVKENVGGMFLSSLAPLIPGFFIVITSLMALSLIDRADRP